MFRNSPKTFGVFTSVGWIMSFKATLPPNYFPEKLYQACRSLAEGGSINYVFEVDSNLDYAIWLHFAGIDPSVKAQGQRMFDVRINNQVVLPNLDIYKLAGGPFSAYDWHFILVNLTGSSLTIDFEAKIGPPLICGLHISQLCMKIYPSFIIFLLVNPTHNWWMFLKCDNLAIIIFIWTSHPNIHIHIHLLGLKEVQM
jgi:hypothetical protein